MLRDNIDKMFGLGYLGAIYHEADPSDQGEEERAEIVD